MRVAIVGSRPKWEGEGQGARMTPATLGLMAEVTRYVDGLPPGTLVVSGGADGVDSWAEGRARQRGLEVEVHRPDYARFGRGAPLVRNATIIERADRVVAFWDGESRGTASAISEARRQGRPVVVIGPDGEVTE